MPNYGSLNQFIQNMPHTAEQYAQFETGVHFTVTGIQAVNISLADIQQLPDLANYIEHAMEQLEVILWNTAPIDLTEMADDVVYRETIHTSFDKDTLTGEVDIGEGAVNESGQNYGKYLQFGAKTLLKAAIQGNSLGIKWAYRRVDKNMGILHDTQRLSYAWMNWFFVGLNDVEFSLPRTKGGQWAGRSF